MSTKITLKRVEAKESGAGFHLYTDCFEELAGDDLVHLRLDGVPFEAEATPARQIITLHVPGPLAVRLGLVGITEQVPDEQIAEVLPDRAARMPSDVRDVIPLPGYRLAVRFFDGVAGIVDMSELVQSPDAGVFAALADPQHFAEVFVEHGVVTWPGELDLAPDAMHAELHARGEWRLS